MGPAWVPGGRGGWLGRRVRSGQRKGGRGLGGSGRAGGGGRMSRIVHADSWRRTVSRRTCPAPTGRTRTLGWGRPRWDRRPRSGRGACTVFKLSQKLYRQPRTLADATDAEIQCFQRWPTPTDASQALAKQALSQLSYGPEILISLFLTRYYVDTCRTATPRNARIRARIGHTPCPARLAVG